jgi:hypothetical protein
MQAKKNQDIIIVRLISWFIYSAILYIYIYKSESLFVCLSVCCWAAVAFSFGSVARHRLNNEVMRYFLGSVKRAARK